MDNLEEVKKKKRPDRPDPFFKAVTQRQATQLGLQADSTEMQYSTYADLVLRVPAGVELEGTMFDFFRQINVVEFKGQNDQLDLEEYVRNELRTDLAFLQSKESNFRNILNVIVSSRRPIGFLKVAREEGIRFKAEKDRPWLLQAKVGFQSVAIIVCYELPIEEKYYEWLAFAPADSPRWKKYVQALVEKGSDNRQLLDIVRRMRPKEYKMLVDEILDQMRAEGLITPEDDAEMEQLDVETAAVVIEDMLRRKSKKLREVLSLIPPEERVAGLKPEELISAMKPEEREELLKKLLAEQSKEEQP